MPPPKLQFAFQGGGAKFIAMLPAAAAISHFAKKGKIDISAVAGTSAGAICAALIAANCDFEKLADFLRKDGNSYIEALVGDLPDLAPISEIKTVNLVARVLNCMANCWIIRHLLNLSPQVVLVLWLILKI